MDERIVVAGILISSSLLIVEHEYLPSSLNFALVFLIVLIVMFFRTKHHPPKIYCKKTDFNNYIIQSCPSLKHGFRPSWLLFSGHLQCFATGLRINPNLLFRREEIDFPDGGCASLDWAENNFQVNEKTPTIVILHGLVGGSSESYVRNFIVECQKKQWRTVVFNFRGAAGNLLKTPIGYCGAFTGDLRIVAKHIKETLPKAPLLAVGYSLGSNVLAKYIGEERENVPFIAAVTLSNPWDLLGGSNKLENTFIGKIYTRILAQGLRRFALRHYDVFKKSDKANIDEVLKANTVKEFDDLATKRLFGYLTVEDYYMDASSKRYLSGVRIPLLGLNSLDDPVSAKECLPYEEPQGNSNVMLVTTDQGGHVAWLHGWNLLRLQKSYMDSVTTEFISAILNKTVKLNN